MLKFGDAFHNFTCFYYFEAYSVDLGCLFVVDNLMKVLKMFVGVYNFDKVDASLTPLSAPSFTTFTDATVSALDIQTALLSQCQ